MTQRWRSPPWGLLDWALARGPKIDQWDLIGCVGPEERSLTAWHYLSRKNALANAHLLLIEDAPSRHRAQWRRKLAGRLREFRRCGGKSKALSAHKLVESNWSKIEAPAVKLVEKGANVVVDVSALPKRFFFPMLKVLLHHREEVPNLVVTYTIPETYSSEKLVMNLQPWSHLPAFAGPEEYRGESPELLIASAGFEPLGLLDQIGSLPTKLLFPFPARPMDVRRAWEFVRTLEKGRESALDVFLTDARSVADTFERLLTLTDNGQMNTELAPFGPKPMSVGMCVFATLTESKVSYAQPVVYNPDYSMGVATLNSRPMIYGHWIRAHGRDFYEIPTPTS